MSLRSPIHHFTVEKTKKAPILTLYDIIVAIIPSVFSLSHVSRPLQPLSPLARNFIPVDRWTEKTSANGNRKVKKRHRNIERRSTFLEAIQKLKEKLLIHPFNLYLFIHEFSAHSYRRKVASFASIPISS